MNKTLITFSLTVIFSLPVMAATEVVSPSANNNGQGGFQGPRHGQTLITSVQEAKDASDDDKVILKGKIKSSLGHEDYIFADDTGEITVEIDDKKWLGRTVTTENTVVLHGEVDKDWNELTIDVDRLEVL